MQFMVLLRSGLRVPTMSQCQACLYTTRMENMLRATSSSFKYGPRRKIGVYVKMDVPSDADEAVTWQGKAPAG